MGLATLIVLIIASLLIIIMFAMRIIMSYKSRNKGIVSYSFLIVTRFVTIAAFILFIVGAIMLLINTFLID